MSRRKPGPARGKARPKPEGTAEPAETANEASPADSRSNLVDGDGVGLRPWFALAIFGVALLVRLVHVWQLRASPFFSLLMGDSRGYDEWARRIAGGDWLGHEVFYQAPLYPYLLGLIYAVGGRHLLLVRLVQAVRDEEAQDRQPLALTWLPCCLPPSRKGVGILIHRLFEAQ